MKTLRDWWLGSTTKEEKTEDPEVKLEYPKYWIQEGAEITYLFSDLPRLKDHGFGWKLHIALDSNPNNLRAAWKIATELCKAYGVRQAKIFNVADNFPVSGKGREITIYLDGPLVNKKSMASFFLNLEIALAARNITPGQYKAPADKLVNGSKYLSFRNDEAKRTKKQLKILAEVQDVAKKMYERGASEDEVEAYVRGKGFALENSNPRLTYYATQEEARAKAYYGDDIYAWNPYCFPDKLGLENIDVSEAYPKVKVTRETEAKAPPFRPGR